MFSQLKNEVGIYDPFTVTWAMKDVGVGTFSFWEKDGKVYCDNEGMSKEFIKKVLCEMVDQSTLED